MMQTVWVVVVGGRGGGQVGNKVAIRMVGELERRRRRREEGRPGGGEKKK